MMRSKFIRIAFFFLIIFSGCSIKDGVKSGSSDEELRDRIMAFWDHKMKEEFDKSYEYEIPVYRKNTRMVQYIGSFNTDVIKWTSVKVEGIRVEGASALVDLIVRTKVTLPGIRANEADSPLYEKWVKVDNVWYHVPGGTDQRGTK